MNWHLLALGISLGAATVGLLIASHRLAYLRGFSRGCDMGCICCERETNPEDVDRIVARIQDDWRRERGGSRRPN